MKRFIMLVITIVFLIGCATFPPPAVAQDQKGTPPVVHKFKIGDTVIIDSGKQKLIATISDIIVSKSKATGEKTTNYIAEIKNTFQFTQGDPRVVPE